MGQDPGSGRTICGCIGQTYSTPAAGARCWCAWCSMGRYPPPLTHGPPGSYGEFCDSGSSGALPARSVRNRRQVCRRMYPCGLRTAWRGRRARSARARVGRPLGPPPGAAGHARRELAAGRARHHLPACGGAEVALVRARFHLWVAGERLAARRAEVTRYPAHAFVTPSCCADLRRMKLAAVPQMSAQSCRSWMCSGVAWAVCSPDSTGSSRCRSPRSPACCGWRSGMAEPFERAWILP